MGSRVQSLEFGVSQMGPLWKLLLEPVEEKEGRVGGGSGEGRFSFEEKVSSPRSLSAR